MHPYIATTDNITIKVRPIYLDGQSEVIGKRFVFAYFIKIENHGTSPVQLVRRHWFIRDASGEVKEVEGEGVVGRQPVIKPGESHEYNSFCVLETFEGSMEGTYQMLRSDGEVFFVVIPRFALRALAN
jgi:ApaG protein